MKVLFYGEEHNNYENTHKFYTVIHFEDKNEYKSAYGRLPGYGNRTKTFKVLNLTGLWDADKKIQIKRKSYMKLQTMPTWLTNAISQSTEPEDLWAKLERMMAGIDIKT